MADLLTAQDIKTWLKKLPSWDHEKKHIERVFEFDDFSQAIEFVNGVAEIAEEDDHHPDIDIRYSKVTLRLSTHSEGRPHRPRFRGRGEDRHARRRIDGRT
ncbi:MAG: 4a-hydroxytetrahydrobiopterin dehydratase [Chthoniobacter sp.]